MKRRVERCRTGPLIGFITGDHAPADQPGADQPNVDCRRRAEGWAKPVVCRCSLPIRVGWELRNPSAGFTATWTGGDTPRGSDDRARYARGWSVFLPASNFGYGILTWHLPMLFSHSGRLRSVGPRAGEPSERCRFSARGRRRNRTGRARVFSMSWKFTRKIDAGAVSRSMSRSA